MKQYCGQLHLYVNILTGDISEDRNMKTYFEIYTASYYHEKRISDK
jgi:hypothetical protein